MRSSACNVACRISCGFGANTSVLTCNRPGTVRTFRERYDIPGIHVPRVVPDSLYIPARKPWICASYAAPARYATNSVTKPRYIPPLADLPLSFPPNRHMVRRNPMHFFNPFGAAHQSQEAASFPEVTANEIEARHANPRYSLGNWAARSPDRPLRMNSWPGFMSFGCCGSPSGDFLGRGTRVSGRTRGLGKLR
jgi:hypothetical protein